MSIINYVCPSPAGNLLATSSRVATPQRGGDLGSGDIPGELARAAALLADCASGSTAPCSRTTETPKKPEIAKLRIPRNSAAVKLNALEEPINLC